MMSVNIHLSLSWEYSTVSPVKSDGKRDGSVSAGPEVDGSASDLSLRHRGSKYYGGGGDEESKCELRVENIEIKLKVCQRLKIEQKNER